MSNGFPNLVENFNTAAAKTAEGKTPIALLLVHYQAAMRHGGAEAEQKNSLTAGMFNSVHKALDDLAGPACARRLKDTEVKDKFGPVLDALCAEECADFLPADAAQRLASIVMKATKTSATVTTDSFNTWSDFETYQVRLTALAALALNYADEIGKPRPAASVETSKDIAPVKRITLKATEGGQP